MRVHTDAAEGPFDRVRLAGDESHLVAHGTDDGSFFPEHGQGMSGASVGFIPSNGVEVLGRDWQSLQHAKVILGCKRGIGRIGLRARGVRLAGIPDAPCQ